MSLLKIDVDPGNLFQRQFTEIEQKSLPFAAMQAVNDTAFEVKYRWEREIGKVFDRPTLATRRAVYITKAKYQRGSNGQRQYEAAIVGIKDEGINPARWLFPHVEGGDRNDKGLERGLRRAGYLFAGERAVQAEGAQLDAFGNVRRGVVQQILSQLGGQFDALANETPASKARTAMRGARKTSLRAKNRRFFAVRGVSGAGVVRNRDGSTRQSHLRAGIYERVGKYRLRSWYVFVRGVRYKKRFEIFSLAQRAWNATFSFHFERELAKAVFSSALKGRA